MPGKRFQIIGGSPGFVKCSPTTSRDEVRKYRTQSRDVARERSIHQSVEESATRLNDWVASDISSPSSRAVRDEDALRLSITIAELPDDQRIAIELHHLQGVPLIEVAEQLNRSREATAMLVYRGMKSLRKILLAEEESHE